MRFERALSAAGELLLGAACHGCSEPWWGICPRCRAAVLSYGCFATSPDPRPAGFPFTVSTAPYDAILRQLIAAHKERGALNLTPFLAGRLAAAIGGVLHSSLSPGSAVVLVPVPSARASVRERGFDATWALARGAARLLRPQTPVRAGRLLHQARSVRDQAGLSAAQRAINLQGAFRVTSVAPGAPVIVVDDVVTTGSSLTEAARALLEAGHHVVGAATVAATQRDRPVSRPWILDGRD